MRSSPATMLPGGWTLFASSDYYYVLDCDFWKAFQLDHVRCGQTRLRKTCRCRRPANSCRPLVAARHTERCSQDRQMNQGPSALHTFPQMVPRKLSLTTIKKSYLHGIRHH